MIWVNGNDPEWRRERDRYAGRDTLAEDAREERYRDWDNLQYWFRGVEKFAPWVNKIHFVTCGHVPSWLNLDHPKLHFVKHADYIPAQCLPTFSSHPIEINMHRIEGLADHFVYFNDDIFLLDEVSPERFFRHGLPCERVGTSVLMPSDFFHTQHVLLNNAYCVNRYFPKHKAIRQHLFKWYNVRYLTHPRCMLQTAKSTLCPHFSSFTEPHLPNSFLRETFTEVWEKCGDILAETSSSRFRQLGNVNQWLFRDWQIAKGLFTPYDVYRDSESLEVSDANATAVAARIRRHKKRIMVLNDSSAIASFDATRSVINSALDDVLPEKCSFEL